MQTFRSAIFFLFAFYIYADVNAYSIHAYMFDGIRILGSRACVAGKLMRCVPSLLLLVTTSLFKGLRQPAADRKLRIFVVVAAQQRLQQQRRPCYNARCVEPRRVAKELEPGRSEFGEVIESTWLLRRRSPLALCRHPSPSVPPATSSRPFLYQPLDRSRLDRREVFCISFLFCEVTVDSARLERQ